MISPTYISAAVALIVFVAGALFNTKLNQEGLMTLATEVVGIVSSCVVLWRRYKKGDINILGAKK